MTNSSSSRSIGGLKVTVLMLLLGLFSPISVEAQICSLCGSSIASLPKRLDCVLSTAPRMNCKDLFFQLARVSAKSGTCKALKSSYEEACCANKDPGICIKQPTQQKPSKNLPKGDQPTCRLCGPENQYPGSPETFINARYVGRYSCGSLYERGNAGLIPSFMCGPLQDYAKSKCVCGEPNPNNPSNGGTQITNNSSGACPSLGKNNCKSRSDCDWKNNSCSNKGGTPPVSAYQAPANNGSCTSLGKDACKDNNSCKWKNNACQDDGNSSTSGGGSGGGTALPASSGTCSSFNTKNECKNDKTCKWKNDKCNTK